MPAEFRDYYTTLGISKDAKDAEIKKAFRKLARMYHPDVAKDKVTAEAKFKEINEAYEVLSDPEKRQKYDALGADWQTGGRPSPPPQGSYGSYESGEEFHFGGTGFSDFFEQYFSGGSRHGFPQTGPSGDGRVRRGNDIEGDILVTLEEAMHGAVRSISLQRTDPRTGMADKQTFQVRIPLGIIDGKRIRVAGHGEAGQGGAPAGDLYLRVRHRAHPDFTTSGSDVFHETPIAPWEAVLGAEITVPSLDGSIKLRIPPAAENGQQLRVRGRGLPKGKGGERGDIYFVLNLQLPPTVSEDERALWLKLRDMATFKPRSE